MSEIAIKASNISKIYRVYDHSYLRIIEILSGNRKKLHFTSHALSNVSFSVEKGTVFGIVGKNGSGKSTLLQILASVLQPTSGSIDVRGRVSALLELGSGFNPDFTGIENIYLYGSILGMSRDEITRKLPDIAAFANIGEYINLPLKTYSSGMTVRLAFSTAVAVDPEILIIDEALSVGDAAFQHECILRIQKIIKSGATVLFVSHDLATVRMLCDRAILLEKGCVVAEGDADSVAKEYHRRLFAMELENDEHPKGSEFAFGGRSQEHKLAKEVNHLAARPAPQYPSQEAIERFSEHTKLNQFGSGEADILLCQVLDSSGAPTSAIEYRESFTIRIFVYFRAAVDSAVVGFVLRNSRGIDIISSNTHIESSNLRDVLAGEVRVVDFTFVNTLRDDHYSVNPAVCAERYFHQARPFHWVDNAVVLRTGKPRDSIVYSLFYPEQMNVNTCSVECSDLPMRRQKVG